MGDLVAHCLKLLILCILVPRVPQVYSQNNNTCNTNDFKALDTFNRGLSTKMESWLLNSTIVNGTNSTNGFCGYCDWDGVLCDHGSVYVIELNLSGRRLKGELNDSLADLSHLKRLNLSQNFLDGEIPMRLFQMKKLEVLDLSYNYFHGVMPREMDMGELRFVDFSENAFGGGLDGFSGICLNSTRIEVVNVSLNNFTEMFPVGFGKCTKLKSLVVHSNSLKGGLPDDLFELKGLNELKVQYNLLDGVLSNRIGNLSNLIALDVSCNYFVGSLPSSLGNLQNLERFKGHSNNFTGSVPSELWNLPSMKVLNLRNNSLSGAVDINCSSMFFLDSLDLGTNKFHGPLPSSLSLCKNLRAINLARNNLSSPIPESFRTLQSLSYLSLTSTNLKDIASALNILQHCGNLTTIVLTSNFYKEVMPSDVNIHFSNLTALVIANCQLTGLVPRWLGRLTNLQLLDVSWNHLSGTVPDWFGEMKFLFYLDISNNSLSGELPKSLSKLESLIFLNITISEASSEFPFFTKRNETSTKDGKQYNQIMSFPPSLDFSHNKLTGEIPPELGKLKKLHNLDLRKNYISGSIPSELSGMRMLENLDLSQNKLTGVIPPSLIGLSFISKFNVSYNNLSGEIPEGGQFTTFSNSSFEGNPHLCGSHFTKLCSLPASRVTPSSSKKGRRNKPVIIGTAIGVGFGIAFLLVLIWLVLNRKQTRTSEEPKEEEVVHITDKNMESSLVTLFEDKEANYELYTGDLLKSTNNFDQANIIGCGGFGLVYKGTLPDGKKVAIKRLSGDCGQIEREFQAEVTTLSKAKHENLVLLRGYCWCKNDRLLIYAYMENGSLDYWLHEKLDSGSSLEWATRLRIAQDSARGLAYLHESCQPSILHRDIKSSNILLDENFKAHLADFGLARLLNPYQTHVSTDLVGTLGYIPPEYGLASVATFKGDIFSFGVVLLELLTGKRPMEMCNPKEKRDMISWVLQMKKEKRDVEVLDPFVYDKLHDKEMLRVLEIACLCLNESPRARPFTQQIVSWLEDINGNG